MKRNPAILATLVAAALTEMFLSNEGERSGVAVVPQDSPGRSETVSMRAVGTPGVKGRLARPPGAKAPRLAMLDPDFLERTVSGGSWEAVLPDGRLARGPVEQLSRDAGGTLSVGGRLVEPEPGRFFFQRQTVPGVAGEMVGHVIFDQVELGWKVEPRGAGGAPMLVETDRGGIVCVSYSMPPAEDSGAEQAPPSHPSDIPIPSYQSVIPLQSLPGASGVLYLDFDGEEGPFTGWGDFDAAPSGASNSQIQKVWQMVAEDFQGFALNVTTDRKVFDEAAEGRRQHVVITPTSTAAPGYGGVAFIGSYNWSGDTVCWAFYSTGKPAAEVISHELGHTLGLGHDGRQFPDQEIENYYGGHGSGETGWAPIMGAGYTRSLTQWSKGEYAAATRFEDDLTIIASYNNDVGYRDDDAGDTLGDAPYLEVFADGTVSGEGIIGSTGDIDAFRFVTKGGEVEIDIDPVVSNPNLDILAEIQDVAGGFVIGSSNPEYALDASLSSNLPAGEYLLRIRGTGRGDPLGDGYSDYGSIGSYSISGSISGGVAAERFVIAENTPEGVPVGTVTPRVGHGAAILTWSITGGNGGGAFAIDATTGEIRVLKESELDHESLSLRWDDPAQIEFFVTISDSLDSSLDETLRVVVTVENVNEAPEASDVALTILERTREGTILLAVAGSDPDPFDFPTFSIASGDPDGWFAIDPGTGALRVDGSISVDGTIVVPLEIRLADQGVPARVATATVTLTIIDIAEGHVPGGVMRTYFEGILGSSVEDLTDCSRWPDGPDSEEFLTAMDGDGHGNYYGSSLRGHVIPPETGSYRFWVSSDDASELWLSSSDDPTGAEVIASVASWSRRYSWPGFGSQQSGWISLTAGVPYYIEVRHKAESGSDHAAVGWTGPGIPKQLLKGLYLSPFRQNYAPTVGNATFRVPEEAFAGQAVGRVTVSDVNLSDVHGDFAIVAGDDGGKFSIDPSSGRISLAAGAWLSAGEQSSYHLVVSARDNGSPPLSGTGVITVNVRPAGEFPNPGVYQQVWTGISTSSLSALTGGANYPYRPDLVRVLPEFDSGGSIGGNYGSRIRALVTPPASGNYRFHLSSDDNSVLLLGSGASAASALEIASVPGSTSRNDWSSYASQTSDEVFLTAGQPYYIETLHKEWGGDDHIQVGWTGPGIPGITVIPGSALQPYDLNVAPAFGPDGAVFELGDDATNGTTVGVVVASDPEGERPVFALTEAINPGVFAIDPLSGAIRVADSTGLTPGVHHLTVSVQDQGIAGAYPLKTASRSVSITVVSSNSPPVFPMDVIELGALQDQPVIYSLAASDPEGGALAFAKTSGPGWLTVDESGGLSGVPRNGDVGGNVFTVRVTDEGGLHDDAILSINVTDVNDPPVFDVDPVARGGGMENEPYPAESLAGSAHDDDTGDLLHYSVVAGPAWLMVAEDGQLSGSPPPGSAGLNRFTIRATDLAGAHAEATLLIEIAAGGLPLPWEAASIGGGLPGSVSPNGARMEVQGSGALGGRNDGFEFVWQALGTDGSITARIDAMDDAGHESRAGVMIRDTLASNSRHVFMGLTGSGEFRWDRRTGFNGNTSSNASGSGETPSTWVRLTRAGNRITALKSLDGGDWITVGSLTAELPETCYFGLAVTSGEPSVGCSAIFSNIVISP